MKAIIIAIVLDKFPAAAMIAVSFPTVAYTNVIVNTQFNSCSSVCVTLVGFIVPSPAKYPLKTAPAATNIIAGASTINVYFTPSTLITYFAIASAPKNRTNDITIPIAVNVLSAILNILCAPLWSPIATLSDTSFDITVGIPTDDKVSNNEYI